MRNEFFGDINDYRKYGLLRTLVGAGDVKLGVCWMLTGDEGRGHGDQTDYLQDSARWSRFDPCLFAALRKWEDERKVRCVNLIEERGLIASAKYHSLFMPGLRTEREDYFAQMSKSFEQSQLIFFDPDNGLEVNSKPYNGKPSGKHLYFGEVKKAFEAKHSLLIYQHFPREDRAKLVERKMHEIQQRTGASYKQQIWIRTAHVVFFLVVQDNHMKKLSSRVKTFCNTWSCNKQKIEIGGEVVAP